MKEIKQMRTIQLVIYWSFILSCVGFAVGFLFASNIHYISFVGLAIEYNDTAVMLMEENYTSAAFKYAAISVENCQLYKRFRLEIFTLNRDDYDDICDEIEEYWTEKWTLPNI